MKKNGVIDAKIIGSNIQAIRKLRNLTPEELGERVHCTSGHIKNIESGTTGISIDLLIDLANALNVPTDSILKDMLVNQDRHYDAEVYELICDCNNPERKFLIELLRVGKKELRSFENDDPPSPPQSSGHNKDE